MSLTNPIFLLKLPLNLVGNGSKVTSFLRLKWKKSKSKPYKPQILITKTITDPIFSLKLPNPQD